MWLISKTIKGKEFIYSRNFTIKCGSNKKALELAKFLNEHNDSANNEFKLKENEVWHAYEYDEYDFPPKYKLCGTKNKITIRLNNEF